VNATDRRALFAANQRAVRRAARRLSSCDEDADDIVQDVAVVVLAHADGPPDAECFVGWCCSVARHLALHRHRGDVRAAFFKERLQHVPSPISDDDPERVVATRRRLEAWLERLDEDAVHLLWNRFVLEETSVEIASRRDVSPQSIRMRLARLLATVRDFEVDRGPVD
jgi:RNA polymerase sigma factor (sigma-70 family)